jgi:hypothetical protein
MISLDDAEMDTIMQLARPLLPADRSAFLEALAAELRAHPGEIGAGLISRIGRQLQGRFLRHDSAARGPSPRRRENRHA